MIRGKGMFTWVIPDCEGGVIDKIILRAKEAQLTFLMPKIANGTSEYVANRPYLEEFVSKCHANGIKVIAWQYVYGANPSAEANRAIAELNKYPYDGFVINAEHEYKNRPTQAEAYCNILRNAHPNLFVGLSSYRYPLSYHPEFPWNQFLKYVDVNMPQVYWEQADGTAVYQLERCLSEFYNPKFIQRPIMPTGSAYTNSGWVAKAKDIEDFINASVANGLDACSFWEWRYPLYRFPELWDAIVNTPFPIGECQVPSGKYKIVMKGNLVIRVGPGGNYAESNEYALTGETHIATEKSVNNWYRIGNNKWISGNTRWTEITEILESPPCPTIDLAALIDMHEHPEKHPPV